MSDLAEKVSGLVETLVLPLVDYPQELQINTSEEANGSIYVEITCNEADSGKIIGRQGRIIKAVRSLARAVVPVSSHINVDVELAN
jgi:uncharacterized protein